MASLRHWLHQDNGLPFTYEALDHQYNIRILWLHAGHWDSPIECDLSTIDLNDVETHEAYEAISYVWGRSTGSRKRIVCNGRTLDITVSLLEALQVFRHPEGGGKRALWADGICINQADTGERNHQVQLMRRIYTAASKVLIWLGHGDAKAVVAGLDLVCQIARLQVSGSSATKPEPEPQYIWRENISMTPIVKLPSRATISSQELKALCPLFDCRWFERLWTIQELALSRTAEVFWGLGQIDFRLVGTTALHVMDHHLPTFLHYNAVDGLKKCCTMQMYKTSAWDEVTFFALLVLTRRSKASDPRDKVFGILGLSTLDSDPESSIFIDPDYSRSMVEVYTAVAKKILFEQKDVDLLAAVQHGRYLSDNRMRHSWVPDWTRILTNYLLNSDRKTSKDVEPVVSAHMCNGCVHLGLQGTVAVRGVVVGTVMRHLTSRRSGWTQEWSHRDLPVFLQEFISSYRSHYEEETLAYTLSGGYAHGGHVIEDSKAHIDEYRAFDEWDLKSYLKLNSSVRMPAASEPESVKAAYRYYANCGPTILGRRLFTARSSIAKQSTRRSGLDVLGLGPLALEESDKVVVLFGASVPFILRLLPDRQHYRLVGECYVHDVMEGQAIDEWRKSGNPARDFKLC